MCRSRRELSNEYLLAKFVFDTAENEPCKVCLLSADRSPRSLSGNEENESLAGEEEEDWGGEDVLASIRLKARKALLGRDEFGARGTPGPAAASDRGAGNYVEYVEGLVGQTHVNSIFLYVILVHLYIFSYM